MAIEYTAEQIKSALIAAIKDGAPDVTVEGLASLLAIYYPHELENLKMAAALTVVLRGTA